jgi:hypothetical protein
MEDRKAEELANEIRQYREQLANNPAASRQLLVDIGIIDEEGVVQENFKHLCIPREQA